MKLYKCIDPYLAKYKQIFDISYYMEAVTGEETTDINNISLDICNSTQGPNQIQCDHCGKCFLNSRGIAIHINKSHPDIHRERLIRKQPQCSTIVWKNNSNNLTNNSENHSTANTSPLSFYKQNLSTWKDKFSAELSDNVFDDVTQQFLIFLSEAIDYLPDPNIQPENIMKQEN
ncbi:hypothetical protein ANN_10310 [Periplaneta americana]|uniref:C2H2-type domain-containing protein n=1 Tax=Periplaneta americana TaxID=6978 RepID=A0ABQ8TQ92_PERAM|nr:hypothetical protein ANN_10310 [Periplaneta americana]